MRKTLPQRFFKRPALLVAKELLGCFLCRVIGGKIMRLEITEVEAYDGLRDQASHASCGQTPRNSPMFGEAGRWYVYFTYGMHWMLNVVTGPKGHPAAVLIAEQRKSLVLRGSRNICGLTAVSTISRPSLKRDCGWRKAERFHIKESGVRHE